jgi:hypothetical protein
VCGNGTLALNPLELIVLRDATAAVLSVLLLQVVVPVV